MILTIPFIVLLICITACYFWWIKGVIFIGLAIYTIVYLLDKLGYELLSSLDLVMASGENKWSNIGFYFIIDKLNYEDFRKEVYNKLILNFRRFRQIQIDTTSFNRV